MTETVEAGDESMKVRLEVSSTNGNGLIASLLGGDRFHLGGIAVAIPRERSNMPGMTCDVSQICLPGHKDVLAASLAAKALALGTGEPVAVSAGIHVDNASESEIERIMVNVETAVKVWLDSYLRSS